MVNYFLMVAMSVNAAYQFTNDMPMWGAASVAIAACYFAALIKDD